MEDTSLIQILFKACDLFLASAYIFLKYFTSFVKLAIFYTGKTIMKIGEKDVGLQHEIVRKFNRIYT